MEQISLDYALKTLETIVNIPSPSGFTHKVSAFLIEELAAMGYQPHKTNKGGVWVDLGGPEGDAILLSCHVDTLGGIVPRSRKTAGCGSARWVG